MKTIQMTIDVKLLKLLDRLTRARKTTRSAFIREAIETKIRLDEIEELESRHARGYAAKPVEPGEFDDLLTEQAWGPR